MKRRLLAAMLALCLAATLYPVSALAAEGVEPLSWADGPDTSWYNGGAPQEEYTLTTAAQLAGLISLINNGSNGIDFENITIRLGNDIVLNDTSAENWTDSAELWDGNCGSGIAFAGTLDGGGHSIIGLYSNTGLFSAVSGTIQNLTIYDAVIFLDVSDYITTSIGAFTGSLWDDGIIEDCSLENAAVTTESYVATSIGGIAGSSSGAIRKCSVNSSEITGGITTGNVGGIAGSSGNIENCTVSDTCQISGAISVGGIAGGLSGTVRNCTNEGTIVTDGSLASAGGIIGTCSDMSGTITGCTNRGTVNAGNANNIGGIIGNVSGHGVSISGLYQ